jgi:hypothetical protein
MLLLKVLVELAELQDHEVGDGTTSVVIIAAELLKVHGSQLQLQLWIKRRALQRKDELSPSSPVSDLSFCPLGVCSEPITSSETRSTPHQ